MTDDEAAFRAAIAAAGDDLAPRHVFADWLDEHDRPDEATYFRQWTPAVGRLEAQLGAAQARIEQLESLSDGECSSCWG